MKNIAFLFVLVLLPYSSILAEGSGDGDTTTTTTLRTTTTIGTTTTTTLPPNTSSKKCSDHDNSTSRRCERYGEEVVGNTLYSCVWCPNRKCKVDRPCMDPESDEDAYNRQLEESCSYFYDDSTWNEFLETHYVYCDGCTGKWSCDLKSPTDGSGT